MPEAWHAPPGAINPTQGDSRSVVLHDVRPLFHADAKLLIRPWTRTGRKLPETAFTKGEKGVRVKLSDIKKNIQQIDNLSLIFYNVLSVKPSRAVFCWFQQGFSNKSARRQQGTSKGPARG